MKDLKRMSEVVVRYKNERYITYLRYRVLAYANNLDLKNMEKFN